MRKLMIAGAWGAMTRKALVEVLALLGLVVALAGCSGDVPNVTGGPPGGGFGYEHPADAPGDLPGH